MPRLISRFPAPAPARDSGFSMIEVLITLLVFSIGLLGLGAMYAQSLSISHNTYLRSLASLQAADMDERIRANPWAPVDGYVLDGTQCVGLGSGATSVAVPVAAQDCRSGAAPTSTCSAGSLCRPRSAAQGATTRLT